MRAGPECKARAQLRQARRHFTTGRLLGDGAFSEILGFTIKGPAPTISIPVLDLSGSEEDFAMTPAHEIGYPESPG